MKKQAICSFQLFARCQLSLHRRRFCKLSLSSFFPPFPPLSLSHTHRKTMKLILRRAIPHIYSIRLSIFLYSNRISVPIIPPNNTNQYSISLSLSSSGLIARPESLTYFSPLAIQAFSILFTV